MHDIIRTLQLWCEEGQVYELRVPKTKRRGVISGYFDDLNALAVNADVLSDDVDMPAVYLTLKGNPRGRKLAESLTKLGAEIEGLERQAAALDSAILDAKAVVRRLERQQAGVSEEEMGRLAEQLREAEERTDGAAKPVTPLDVEAALVKALESPPSQSQKTTPRQGVASLVGKWRLIEGKRPGTVEFTRGGTALLAWDDGIANALGERQRRATLKYRLAGNVLRLQEPGEFEYRQKCDVQIEFIGQDEIILVNQKNSLSFDWLDGRAKRVK